jgi:LPXTG-motif cell wall-anchored protein
MHDLARRGLAFSVATGGLLLSNAGFAVAASSSATGNTSDSPGVASGNNVQVPVNLPVNLCGDTVNVLALLNPSAGNGCAIDAPATHKTPAEHATGGPAATASSNTSHSPGALSGNNVQVPVNAPINACGDTLNLAALLNPAAGDHCVNGGSGAGGAAGGPSANAAGDTSHSPGAVSGNSAQVPINLPINACGDTVNGIAGLNPAVGDHCAIGGPAAGGAAGGPSANAAGIASHSPGAVSGNSAQVPINLPINLCGDTVNGIAGLNPAVGSSCEIGGPAAGGAAGGPSANAAGITSHSPGAVSGNAVQLPINVPVNACGDTVNGIAGLNPAANDHCAIGGPGTAPGGPSANAAGITSHSPGAVSGNAVQLPINVPVNACGDTVNGIAGLNPATGNGCEIGAPEVPTPPPSTGPVMPPPPPPTGPVMPPPPPPTGPVMPPPPPPTSPVTTPGKPTPPAPGKPTPPPAPGQPGTPGGPRLAHTGAEGTEVGIIAGAAALVGGAALTVIGRKRTRRGH